MRGGAVCVLLHDVPKTNIISSSEKQAAAQVCERLIFDKLMCSVFCDITGHRL